MLTAARAFARRLNVDSDPCTELICHSPRSIEPSVLTFLADALPPDSAIATAAAMFAASFDPPARVHRFLIWPTPSPNGPVNATWTWS
jgi:hypothetical protein